MIKKIILIITSLLAVALYATNENMGTTGFSFLKMNYSARALGMGNAFTGHSDDGDAVFFNPAGLTQTNTRHLKTTLMNYIQGMNGGSLVYSTDYSEDWKISPFLQFLVSNGIEKRDVDNVAHGTFHTSNILAGIGFAKTLNEVLDVGFNIKYLIEKLDDSSATAAFFDIGILHTTQNKNLKIGAAFKNVGMQITYFSASNYKEKMPMMLVGGASYNILDRATINLDVCSPINEDYYGKVGAEFQVNPVLTLRAGVDTRMNDYRADQTFDIFSGIAFGLGFVWNEYIIDFATASMGNLGLVNQISLTYRF